MRRVLVDASAFVTLAAIGRAELLRGVDARIEMPAVVQVEIVDGPAAGALERATASGERWIRTPKDPPGADVERAEEHLGRAESARSFDGDVEVLAPALGANDPVVVTDEEPLRKTSKALGVPVSGSIGVVIAAVERGDLEPDGATDALVAMDEVGARLSARLFRRAERLIEEVAEGGE